MHENAEEKKRKEKQTNKCLIDFCSRECPFWNKSNSTYLLWIIFIVSIVLCLSLHTASALIDPLSVYID
jgi:hypothetical protein